MHTLAYLYVNKILISMKRMRAYAEENLPKYFYSQTKICHRFANTQSDARADILGAKFLD